MKDPWLQSKQKEAGCPPSGSFFDLSFSSQESSVNDTLFKQEVKRLYIRVLMEPWNV